MLNESWLHEAVRNEAKCAEALRSAARRQDVKLYVEQSPEIYRIVSRAAARYIAGETRQEGIVTARQLMEKGYAVSLEYIGENTADAEECKQAALEFMQLIQELGRAGMTSRISLDLSHIGLAVDPELAYLHLTQLAELAQLHGMELVISMEESEKTEGILAVYERAAAEHSHVGITLQAQLERTPHDLERVLACPGRIRIVKGAYLEDESIPRSDALNARYLELLDRCIRAGQPVSIATHDERLIRTAAERGYLKGPQVELEMLYGIRPDLAANLRAAGAPVRIYLTYGSEWFLYLLHRIAEYPPNVYTAITDMITGAAGRSALY
ncbi:MULTISPECIES: proline dehydrogenase family protein [Paenibacillus]|uniref:proline dehydrogenase family protein n=1 Tax=Paenibacillus TaxID=44249 RepID=UPI0022B8C724|nr:proline dehydrogenase family protein [Paenibacillus caseinilyticus]MCZ8520802.1 proline dehydrogenase family protein [Paenibacillus caseinilyticus]